MIQRTQSIYLLLITILIGIMTFFTFAEITTVNSEIYSFNIKGIFNTLSGDLLRNTLSVNLLIGITSLIAFATILLYKKRTLQIRLCIYNMILLVGLSGLLAYYIFDTASSVNGEITFKIALTFPLVALILTFLAFRNIRKDDAIVRSLDRIR